MHATFVLCACACNNGVVKIFKNRLTLFKDETNDQECPSSVLSASVQKRRQRKMYKHWNTVIIMKVWLSEQRVGSDSSQHDSTHLYRLAITPETTIQLIHRPCSSIHVSTKVLIKHLVSERNYSRKYDNTLWAHIY